MEDLTISMQQKRDGMGFGGRQGEWEGEGAGFVIQKTILNLNKKRKNEIVLYKKPYMYI